MYSLAFILAAIFVNVDCKQLVFSYPLRETCSPPPTLCTPPAPLCAPPVPICAPPAPVCAPPAPVCTPPIPVCAPPVPVCAPAAIPVSAPSVAVCEVPRPAMPFVTDLRTCPDFYFTDILLSPLGSLDPIITIFGCPEPALPEVPSSPLKALSCSCGPPPGFTEDYSCDCFLKRGCIPPPFI